MKKLIIGLTIIVIGMTLVYVFLYQKSQNISGTSAVSGIRTGMFTIDPNNISTLQVAVNNGHQPWRLDPESVVKAEAEQYGFIQSDLTSLRLVFHAASAATNEYEIPHDEKLYVVSVIQPVPKEGHVWAISSIKLK